MQFDLHTHSTASDGTLDPLSVWTLASEKNLDLFALTDHDTLAGYLQLKNTQEVKGSATQLVSGVEISSAYYSQAIHIVALNFDSQDTSLLTLLDKLQQLRADRAEKMALKLEKILKIENIFQKVQVHSGNDAWQLARPHFARYLIEEGHASNEAQVFKRWLGNGKKAYVTTPWPDYKTVISTINQAGGVAVLAHPLKYKISRTRLKAMVSDFALAGGKALEVNCYQQKVNDTQYLLSLCQRNELLASGGSDFHSPDMPWAKVGQVAELPEGSTPVWSVF